MSVPLYIPPSPDYNPNVYPMRCACGQAITVQYRTVGYCPEVPSFHPDNGREGVRNCPKCGTLLSVRSLEPA